MSNFAEKLEKFLETNEGKEFIEEEKRKQELLVSRLNKLELLLQL